MKPVAYIDLFCGMGGFSLGANRAGATCLLAVDAWEEAIAVHNENFPFSPTTCMELGHDYQFTLFRGLVDDRKEAGFHVHIHGSPPCQALSNASVTEASKGMPLIGWFLRLVDHCEPDSWSMENVLPVRRRLPENTPTTVLNAADFGVPQTRRRCFAGVGWTVTKSHDESEWVSVIDALPELREELLGLIATPSMVEHYKKADMEKPFPTITRYSPFQLRLKLEATGSNANRANDSPLSSPSKTLCGSGNQVGPRIFDHDQETPFKIRSLNLSETMVLQGFPREFDLGAAKTQKSRWTMVGNAVCPPVAEAVIRGIEDVDVHR